MDLSERRKIRNEILFSWAFFASLFLVFSFFSGPRPPPEFVVVWLAMMVGILAVVGLPLTYVFVLANHRLTSQWGERWRPHPFPSPFPGPPAAAAPFRYMGRRWKPIVGILTFLFALLVVSWLMPATGVSFLDAILLVFRLVALALAAFGVPASVLGLRAVTFEVDDLGVRVRGRFRPFDVRWDDLERLEVTRYPSPPFTFGVAVRVPNMYGLWRKTGTVAGIIAPGGELDKRVGAAFEAAVLAYTTRRGIPVVAVPWRATRVWGKMRDRAVRLGAR